MKKGKLKTYALFILIPLLVGGLSSLLTRKGMEAFDALQKPSFAPPDWLFPIVWALLYILMGISMAMVWESGDSEREQGLFVFGAQLFVNFWWSIFFFAWQMRLLAFFWLLLLIALVVWMIRLFQRLRPPAGLLNVPYLLWLAFAAWLNLSVYLLNK